MYFKLHYNKEETHSKIEMENYIWEIITDTIVYQQENSM